jgi:hypothetical protein
MSFPPRRVWDAARREVVARNGGRWQADAMRAMMGMSSPEWSHYLHDQLCVPLKPERINELVVAALLDRYRRRLPLLPGAVVAVRRLADRWPLGLASSVKRHPYSSRPLTSCSPAKIRTQPRKTSAPKLGPPKR